MILPGDARSGKKCLAPLLSPTTLYQEGEKPSEYYTFVLLLPKAGIEPRPFVQQASAQSVSPLPLGEYTKVLYSLQNLNLWHIFITWTPAAEKRKVLSHGKFFNLALLQLSDFGSIFRSNLNSNISSWLTFFALMRSLLKSVGGQAVQLG